MVVMLMMPVHGTDEHWLFLKSFDVDAHSGFGQVNLTYDKANAMHFESVVEATEAWRTQSRVRPIRPDGKPNRPLTAFHATFEEV